MHETRPRGDAPGVPCRAEIRCWKAWVGGWVGGWIHLGSGRRCDNIHTATLKSLLRPHFRPIYCARRHTGYGFCLSSHLALTVRCVCACGPQRVVAARAHQHAAGGAASVWAIQRPTVNPGTGAGDGGGSAWGGAKRRGLVSCRAAEKRPSSREDAHGMTDDGQAQARSVVCRGVLLVPVLEPSLGHGVLLLDAGE